MRDKWADDLERLTLERGGKVGKINRAVLTPKSSDLPLAQNPPSTQTLVIDDWTPVTLNRAMRRKIKERIAIGKATHTLIETEAFRQGLVKATGARQVQVTVVFPSKFPRPDPDNLAKVTLDSLTRCGMLIDDKYEMCVWMPPVYFTGDKQTMIELTDIEAKKVERWPA